jgi:hypothetical protein
LPSPQLSFGHEPPRVLGEVIQHLERLRPQVAWAPYFHNGSAATLLDAVNFYDQRFNIGFTAQDRRDLAAFLQTL